MVGIAMRPGNQIKDLAPKLGIDGENLVHTYIKLDSDNSITAVIPHSEMGQGVHTALGQMLAEELDADWNLMKVEEAPALGEYASYSAGRRYLLAGIEFPKILIPTVDGMMMRVADTGALYAQDPATPCLNDGVLAVNGTSFSHSGGLLKALEEFPIVITILRANRSPLSGTRLDKVFPLGLNILGPTRPVLGGVAFCCF